MWLVKCEWKASAKPLKEFSLFKLNRVYRERTKLGSSAVMNRRSSLVDYSSPQKWMKAQKLK